MPTVIGVIFFLCAVYCFLLKEEWLFGLLIISIVFEAASAINFGERGVQSYYIVSAFVLARGLLRWGRGAVRDRRMPQGVWLLIFAGIVLASAIVLPIVFAGTPVYDPKIGIDEGFFVRPPLTLGINNYVQAAFLLWHVATAYALLAINTPNRKVYKAYLWAFYILVAVVAAESVCQLINVPFPHSVFLNNPGYSLWGREGEVSGMRNPGTFSEPSLAGGFLGMYVLGFLAKYLAGKGGKIKVIVSMAASGLVTSGGSLFTISLLTPFLLLKYMPFRWPWFVNISKAKRLAWVLLVFSIPPALLLVAPSGYTETLTTNTVSKGESSSFINRTASDLYALQLVAKTDGLGVGMGSNRASSLITTVLSNVGVAGFLVFGVYLFRLFGKLPQEYAWLKWAAAALLINMCINIPDFTAPMLWLPVFLAIQFSSSAGGQASGGTTCNA
jgi:hypothetical protein